MLSFLKPWIELADKNKELRSAKAAVAKARTMSDVELPKPLADAFLQRFGGCK